MFFSVIVPLYNRPQEIQELLESLVVQDYKDFEVIVVEDGSKTPAKHIVESFGDRLDVRYFYKENEGQGFARNYGFDKAKGDFFIVFDSDVIISHNYFSNVISGLQQDHFDAFGGPDAAHDSFTDTQKAIGYSMTSPFTTGGIRGNKKHVGQFHPRSFNMGISREVFQKTGGFKLSRRSEDIEFSIRMLQSGFRVGLIAEAFVYHKRRTSFVQFFRQTFQFGKGRIDIYKLYPSELKLVHTFPAFFVVGWFVLFLLLALTVLTHYQFNILNYLLTLGTSFVFLYTLLLFLHALITTKSLSVASKAIVAAYTQFVAYGVGFISQFVKRVLLGK